MTPEDVKKVAKYIDSNSEYNLSQYSISSLQRRFNTLVSKIKKPDTNAIELIAMIKSNPDFIQDIINEITVPTTEMFRNPSMWVSMIELLMDNYTKDTPLKVLHNPSSTGEEVYTMSILLHELGYMYRDIIGVDINTKSLNEAKEANYSNFLFGKNEKNYKEFKNNQNESLKKYFEYNEQSDTLKLNQQFKKRVTFYDNDNISKYHINSFDIIFCRNLLIYFEDDLQEKFLRNLTNHLKVGGFLILGAYEVIRSKDIEKQYKMYNIHHKIFQKIK